ncbi:unnamed protein product [Effrenium voratum]|uniref:Uncharacterized protein n=1 Tax=Effrenium voratum TaxID=2562239 RepID=A0AA36I5P5_9DINO|nr:unnamed protein product [Effrenium voratum]CAJ1439735.1 unnamed protein product [Effrenium voratum]
MDEASVLLDQARESAVEKVACPICFEGLSEYPDQVGALTLYGNRVESALYHSSCVLNPDTGHLIFESQTGRAVSPLTRQQVDGFKCMPGLSEGQSWAKFLDWNSAGHLDLQKVCAGVAALLPVDDATARRFVVKVLHKSANCGDHAELPLPEVVATLLPAIRRQLRRLLVAPRPRAPEICRNSSKEPSDGGGPLVAFRREGQPFLG